MVLSFSLSPTLVVEFSLSTVEPLNKDTFGTSRFVLSGGVSSFGVFFIGSFTGGFTVCGVRTSVRASVQKMFPF